MIEKQYPTNDRDMSGSGTFAEGRIEKTNDGQWYVDAATNRGEWYRGFVDEVYVGFNEKFGQTEFSVEGMDFRIGDDELLLRDGA